MHDHVPTDRCLWHCWLRVPTESDAFPKTPLRIRQISPSYTSAARFPPFLSPSSCSCSHPSSLLDPLHAGPAGPRRRIRRPFSPAPCLWFWSGRIRSARSWPAAACPCAGASCCARRVASSSSSSSPGAQSGTVLFPWAEDWNNPPFLNPDGPFLSFLCSLLPSLLRFPGDLLNPCGLSGSDVQTLLPVSAGRSLRYVRGGRRGVRSWTKEQSFLGGRGC
jgi:hypothetical protein